MSGYIYQAGRMGGKWKKAWIITGGGDVENRNVA